MTTIKPRGAAAPPAAGTLGLRTIRWHRPLLVLAIAMTGLAVVAIVGLIVDPREVTGLPVWAKPLKFALSTGIYAVTLAWLVGQVVRFRRLAEVAATITAVTLGIELIIVTAFAVAAETSHFNVSTPVHTIGWSIMGTSIAVLWTVTFGIALALFLSPLGDRARSLAIRAGMVLAIVGMGLAFLMTSPTADQLADFEGIAGAHTVGLADGGPGLPILGWSTVAGDLRVPHFVGMHALQALPLLALLLEIGARRIPRLADSTIRFRIVLIASVGYAAAVGLATWQALIGQSIIAPAGPILTVGSILVIGVAVAVAVALSVPTGHGRRALTVSFANKLC
jgi:hypothetical protein